MTNKSKQACLISCVFLLCSGIFIKTTNANDILKISGYEYPPLIHNAKNGNVSGTVIETLKEMCIRADIKCVFNILPFKRAYMKLERSSSDTVISMRLQRFEECCHATDWFIPWVGGIFTNDRTLPAINTPEDLIGKSLIVVAGMKAPYQFIPDLDKWEKEKKITVFHAPNIPAAVRMFSNKRATYLYGSAFFSWLINRTSTNDEALFYPTMKREVTLWVSKEKEHLIQKLNVAFEEMKTLGLIDNQNLLNNDLLKNRYVDAVEQS